MTRNAAPVLLQTPAIRLEVLPLGATLRRFNVALPDGTWRNILLGHPDPADYRTNTGYLGASVGRFANRIAGARFSLDGVEYRLDANEPPNLLHGGGHGFSAKEWTLVGAGPDWAEFTVTSPVGDQGFPGRLEVTARFEVHGARAGVTYTARTDAPTVVNLTTHPYFNLNADGSVDDHLLQVLATQWTPTDAGGIPTGEVRDVAGTATDFRTPTRFGDAQARLLSEGIDRRGGFDHNFVIDGAGLRPHCRLSVPGLTLEVASDQPAMMVYGGDHFAGEPGTSGRSYPPRAGVALEAQGFPDAPNQPGFPSSVLRPGELYTAATTWTVRPSV